MTFGRIAAAVVVTLVASSIAAGSPCGAGCARVAGDELDAFRKWVAGPVKYLLSEKEKRLADVLAAGGDTVTPQRLSAFRHWFWERRDPSPGTLRNEFRDEFLARVDYVNKEYRNPDTGLRGWQAPQGVVYVMLGPPTGIVQRAGRPRGELNDVDVEVWIYDRDDASVLEVPFVDTGSGPRILVAASDAGIERRLDAALARAALDCIRNRDLPYRSASPLPEAEVTSNWPATGSVSRSREGIEGQLSVPLADLYGTPLGDDLRIDLRLEIDDPGTGMPTLLGDVTVVIRPQDFQHWRDRILRVALWLPGRGTTEAASSMTITEVVSGRSIRLPVHSSPGDVARAYEVEHLLGSARLLDGTGAAFAFIGRDSAGADPRGTVWVLRPPQEIPGIVIEEPVRSLLLVRASGQQP